MSHLGPWKLEQDGPLAVLTIDKPPLNLYDQPVFDGLVEIVVGLTPSMGGPQRLTEKAGPTRAKDLVMSGELFDAQTMREWGIVSRVWPDADFETQAREFAVRLASGPTLAHAATKELVKAAKEEGARAADAIVPEVGGGLFGTEDLQNAVESFLRDGPGKATYEGR